MNTVGTILREAREKKHVTIAQVEQATKIREKFLLAIEEDRFVDLPSHAYAKGFVKNYSEYLGIPTNTIMAFYRRQTKDVSRSSLLPSGMASPLNEQSFRLTPARFFTLLIVGFIGLFLTYFIRQYRALSSTPQILIESPKDGQVVTSQRVEITGITDPDATLTVNGISVLVRSDGKFFDYVVLSKGSNEITIVATSRYGKTSTAKKIVEQKDQE